MDLDGKTLVIPVSATRHLSIAGGPPMVQAIPEEYVLASHALMFLNMRKGEDLEFIMKAYLPIKLLKLSRSAYAFVDMLGLISSPLRIFTPENVKKLVKKLEDAKDVEAIIDVSDKMCESLIQTASAKSKSVLGLLSGHHVDAISSLLQWPSSNYLEPYAFVLPTMVNEGTIHIIGTKLADAYEHLAALREDTRQFDEILDEHVSTLSQKTSSSISGRVGRLDQRIGALEDEISYLESRIQAYESRESLSGEERERLEEIQSKLKSRMGAYERDMKRRKRLRDNVSSTVDLLTDSQQDLRNTIKQVWINIEKVKREYDSIAGQFLSSEITEDGEYLLIPVSVAGLSKKGRLRVVIVPPKQLLQDPDKVSMRKDFVYPFSEAVSQVDVLIRILSERANHDISFRKTLRDASRERNLLSLEPTRKLLKEGAELLLADGLAKSSEIRELDEFLSQVPTQSLSMDISEASLAIDSSENGCKVSFNICDDEGNAIANALIEIGAIRLISSISGKADVSLPLSNYEGRVEAKGYHDRKFDFTLSKPGDIVLPLVLASLSPEEKLDQELDDLVGRAERIALIRRRLAEAFDKHGDTLLQIPAYRNVLTELLSALGLEPESWIAKARTQRGMMKRLLRRDEREERIQRDVLRLADESKKVGGIMLYSELLLRLDKMGWEVSSDSLEDIIDDMTKEGLIEGITSLEDGPRIVKFIPVSLTNDPQQVMALASKNNGRLTIEETVVGLGWTEERVRNALELLVENGVAKLQRSFSRSTQYWFPGLKGRKK